MLEDDTRRRRLLELTPLEEVWGVGRQLAPRLQALGLHSAYDLAQVRRAF